MDVLPTETALRDWRYGQTQAERLCAELLLTEGFSGVDPQCPLGGPDGLKDLLCKRENLKWVAACYFPPTLPKPSQISGKLEHDLQGLEANNADGLVFFVNQSITPGNRDALAEIAKPSRFELFHLERIRAILDSPMGYGLRLEYLRIPMSAEEQLGFFSTFKNDLTAHLQRQERAIHGVSQKMDLLLAGTSATPADLLRAESSLIRSRKRKAQPDYRGAPTESLSINHLFWLHRLLTTDTSLSADLRGRFRSVQVWIATAGSKPEEARFTPPPPEEVPMLTEKLLEEWRNKYTGIIHASYDDVIHELAAFHHGLLSIHPFLDANGRVARALFEQQALELLKEHPKDVFSDRPVRYLACLSDADGGDLQPLISMMRSALE